MTSAWENSVQLCVDDLRQRLPVRCVLVAGEIAPTLRKASANASIFS